MLTTVNLLNIVSMYRYRKSIMVVTFLSIFLLFPAFYCLVKIDPEHTCTILEFIQRYALIFVFLYVFTFIVYLSNSEIDKELIQNCEYKSKLLAIIENLDQGLVIIEDKKIDFLNSKFYDLLLPQILDLSQNTQTYVRTKLNNFQSIEQNRGRRCFWKKKKKKPNDEGEPEESHRLLEMNILRQYERDQIPSASGEKISLNHVLNLDRSMLNELIFVMETPGEDVYLQIKKSNLENGLVLQIQDISDSILQHQLRQEKDSLTLINACVSHELRNPLNSIIAQNLEQRELFRQLRTIVSSELAAGPANDRILAILDSLGEGLNILESSSEIMTFLVQDLLDYAQIKSGKFRKNLSFFNIASTIEKCMRILKRKAEGKGISLFAEFPAFEIDGAGSNSPMLFTDEQRLMQVILNLQSNAIKFTPNGHVKIVAEVVEQDGVRLLQIQVIDTGVGISQSNQQKLFKLFGFLSETESMNTNGIGLGLVISKQIVNEFGGTISVKSEPGRGSNFTFTFNIQEEQHIVDQRMEHGAYEANSRKLYFWDNQNLDFEINYKQFVEDGLELGDAQLQKAVSSPGKKLLIVDDQEFNIAALKIFLKYSASLDEGVIVDQATSGEQAIDLILTNLRQNNFSTCSYSIIFMDCNMPFMDGYECTEKIREILHHHRVKQPVVAAVTGHIEQTYINKSVQSGMNMVFSKPVNPDLLTLLLDFIGMRKQ